VPHIVAEDYNANTLLDLGIAYERQGDFVQAIKVFEQVKLEDLRLSKKTVLWNVLSRCYAATGSYVKSTQCLKNLLGIVTLPQSRDAIWLNISDNQWNLGDYKAMQNSLDSVADQNLTITRRINALVAQGEYDLAINKLNNFISESNDRDEKVIAIQNEGYIEWARGDLSTASQYLNSAIKLMSTDSPNYPIVLSNYGYILGCNKDYSNALEKLDTALAMQKRSKNVNNSDMLISLRKKGEIEIMVGHQEKASKTLHSYFVGARLNLLETLTSLTPTQRLGYWAKEKPLLSKCFLLEDYDAEFLFEVAMFRRQTSLLGMHDVDNLKKLLCVTTKQVRSSLKKNEAAVEFISYEPERNKKVYAAIVLPKVGKAKFVRLFDESDIYIQQHGRSVSLFDAIKQDVRKNKDDLYTDTIWGNRIWSPILNELPNNVSKIYFAPEGVFHLLGIENLPFVGKTGKEFHRVTSIASLVSEPTHKKSKQQNMLIIGGLDYDDMDVVKTDTIVTANREAADYLCKYMGGAGSYFQYLRGTKAEVDTISTILNQPTLKYKVSESSIKELLPQFNIVHVATHGYCLDLGIRKQPEYLADSIPYDKSLIASGLVLSGANKAITRTFGEDEILSARELCDLDLSNVDFVVLSACETAKGDISDEGAAGIVRGLKNAGVKTILASLWSVDDKSTALFMQEFYKRLGCGESRYQSFIAAQEYLRNYREEIEYRKFSAKTLAKDKNIHKITISYNSPYYWAPFILIDEY
jgi:CHAT domain-containing protein/tetratricopeptide (TPR) repeat protein